MLVSALLLSAWASSGLGGEAGGQEELHADQHEILCWSEESSGDVERDRRNKRGKYGPDHADGDSGESANVLARYFSADADSARRSEINGDIRSGRGLNVLEPAAPGAKHADHLPDEHLGDAEELGRFAANSFKTFRYRAVIAVPHNLGDLRQLGDPA
jgi:hypothetical protein